LELVNNIKEDLFDAMARLEHVRRAAERLGVSPQEVAKRLHPGLIEYRRSLAPESVNSAYDLIRYIRDAARALT
jgi:hypothetical protein